MGASWCADMHHSAHYIVSLHLVERMNDNEQIIATNVFDECEIHENCTVEIWKNSTTGEISIGWYENKEGEPNAYR